MVIDCGGVFGVSLIKKGHGKVSLHLISVFSENEYGEVENSLETKDYNDYVGKKGTWLESSDDLFKFPNPLVTSSALEMFEFLIEAKNWAKRNQ